MAGVGTSSIEFRLPDVGEGLDEAEVVTWLVAEGDEVARDQPLVEILTDKAQVELPSPVAGRIRRLAVPAGERVPVGTVLVELEAGNGPGQVAVGQVPQAVQAPDAAPPAIPAPAVAAPVAAEPARAEPVNGARLRPKASPSTRRLASELGVDLRQIHGTGPGGRVLADDVRSAAESRGARAEQPASASVTTPTLRPVSAASDGLGRASFGVQPLRGVRRLTARAMAQSWSEIPHITGMDEVDATALLEARRRLQELAGVEMTGLTPLALLAMAVGRALRHFPLVNATLDLEAETVTVHEHINLGIAVATDAGLVVPVVTDADRRGLAGLAAEIVRLATAARSRTVTPAELRGGTFTITNYGSLGGRFATPIIRPGESGIMGFGAIRPRPIVVDGAVEARPTLPVVFSADHRLIDGDLATAFQEYVIARVREPLSLLLEV